MSEGEAADCQRGREAESCAAGLKPSVAPSCQRSLRHLATRVPWILDSVEVRSQGAALAVGGDSEGIDHSERRRHAGLVIGDLAVTICFPGDFCQKQFVKGCF